MGGAHQKTWPEDQLRHRRRTNLSTIFVSAATVLILLNTGSIANAAELRLLSPRAMALALNEIVPKFESSSGHTVTMGYASAATLARRIESGEATDVAILSPMQNAELQKRGKIVAGSSVVIARVGFGIIIAKDAAKPDISSTGALKRSLVAASSIAVGDPVTSSSGKYLVRLADRFRITGELTSKIKTYPSGFAALNAIAKGEAEMGLEVMSAANAPGLELAGPLPAEVQSFNSYTAAIVSGANQVEAATELISFISSPASAAVMKAKGFDVP